MKTSPLIRVTHVSHVELRAGVIAYPTHAFDLWRILLVVRCHPSGRQNIDHKGALVLASEPSKPRSVIKGVGDPLNPEVFAHQYGAIWAPADGDEAMTAEDVPSLLLFGANAPAAGNWGN